MTSLAAGDSPRAEQRETVSWVSKVWRATSTDPWAPVCDVRRRPPETRASTDENGCVHVAWPLVTAERAVEAWCRA
jgi:hypothetical protein